jgi:hypothetical protein
VNVTLPIPDDLAARLGAGGPDLARQALEALAAEAYRAGRLTGPELQQLLGFGTAPEVDGFLRVRGIDAATIFDRTKHAGPDAHDTAARIRAFRRGRTLGGLNPAVLIREGRR